MADTNLSLLSKLQQLLSQKKSKAFYAEKLNVPIETVEELIKELKEKRDTLDDLQDLENEEVTTKVNIDKGTLESTRETTFDPKTVDELAKLHKVDLSLYKITNYWSKLKANGKFTSSIFATRKKDADYSVEDFEKFLDKWKFSKRPKSNDHFFRHDSDKEEVDVELNVADFHLAKKTFEGDTLETKEFDYYFVVSDLISKIKKNYNINKLVFPISNDFFHTDNYQNWTTNGTPQDVTAWFDEEYEKGFDILANTIDMLRKECKELKVILVQGNHDRTKGFYVAHALEVLFRDDRSISFQREHSTLKAVVLGNTFIGYHHGNSCKLQDLPLIFATGKYAHQFGNATYREIHTGDKHHYMAKEVQGVRIQQMPSLSKTDRWHRDNNFENKVHAALALVYHPEQGKIAEFEIRL